ncbi:ABC transporter substrate-binding protein [Paenibacillus oralis]|uniref:ABC transporter substrate-binding protein n=1 Tax=Paenibacillus oralis TaxID=2490856 RepID=A0A3P3UA03_9BACL|nr:metal ABC transporter substrate-binding protein [Paenibacillus oralis]RRJ67181.1 ABC transporter substrate-binding protein [Paenibacillus oralis]
MKFWNRSLTVLSLSVMLVAAGCGSNAGTAGNAGGNNGSSAAPEAGADKPAAEILEIKTSFYPMYEFTRHVAGDLANVENLVPAGMEPHDWEPTPQDMAAISEADVLVYNGAGMEGWAEQVLDSAKGTGLKAIEASHGIEVMEGSGEHDHGHEHEHGEEAHEEGEHAHEEGEHAHEEGEHAHEGEEHEEHGHDHDHGGLDPHVWLSPALAIQEVRNIEKGLSEAAPEYKDTFKANADAYVAELEALDKEFTEALKDSKRKDFITQHAAFGYLAKQYGLTQVPIAGLSPDHEPSAAQMAEIVEFAKEHNVKTIFFETLVSSKVADTIASEIGAKSAVLNPIEGLTEEELAGGLDYIAVMRQNLDALKTALNE